jgi:hypothetical protein
MAAPWVPVRLGRRRRADLEALYTGAKTIAAAPELFDLALAHQVAAPLAALARSRGDEVPEPWAGRLADVRAQNLAFAAPLAEIAEVLDATGCLWLAARGAARLSDPLMPDRLCGDIDVHILAEQWPEIQAALARHAHLNRRPHRGDKNRSTRHFSYHHGVRVDLDIHLAPSPFHAQSSSLQRALLNGRQQTAAGLWVASAEDEYGLNLLEALMEAPANRLRRLWELDALKERLSPGELQRMRRRFGLRRWAHSLPSAIFDLLQGTPTMRTRNQLMTRYTGVLALITASRRPLRQSADTLRLMARRFLP